MSFTSQDVVYVAANRGFNTEANKLAFPEGFVADEENFVITRRGTHHRRLGIDYEPDYELLPTLGDLSDYESGHIDTYIWENAGGTRDVSFLVVREGSTLSFYNYNSSVLSANRQTPTINLDTFTIKSYSTSALTDVQFSNGYGMLFVVGPAIKPLLISYTPEGAGRFIANPIDVRIRDLRGLEDGLSVTARPSVLSGEHKYNLLNQGWTSGSINTFRSQTGVYPSNADIWHFGKFTNIETGQEDWSASQLTRQQFGTTPAPKGSRIISVLDSTFNNESITISQDITNVSYISGNGVFFLTVQQGSSFSVGDIIHVSGTTAKTSTQVAQQVFGSTYYTTVWSNVNSPINGKNFRVQAVVGNILTIYTSYVNQDELTITGGTVSMTSVLDLVDSNSAPSSFSTVEFAHGRAWFSGVSGSDFSGHVFFSRVLELPELAGDCFQEADPTSEHISDLIASDGGYIVIPEAGEILKIMSVGRSIVVWGTRGIWSISGADESFTATQYEVSKISTVKLTGRNTVIDAEGSPFFFAESGLYVLTTDEVTGKPVAQSISADTIQTYYESIPISSRQYAKAVYNPLEKIVYWFYKGADNLSPYFWDFDRALIFSAINQGFYKFKIERNDEEQYFPIVSSAFAATNQVVSTSNYPISVGDETVLVDDDVVVINRQFTQDNIPGIICLTAVPSASGVDVTFSRFLSGTFMDWVSYDFEGTNYTSYIESAYETLGDLMREKQVQWLYTFFDRGPAGFNTTPQALPTEPTIGEDELDADPWPPIDAPPEAGWMGEGQQPSLLTIYYSTVIENAAISAYDDTSSGEYDISPLGINFNQLNYINNVRTVLASGGADGGSEVPFGQRKRFIIGPTRVQVVSLLPPDINDPRVLQVIKLDLNQIPPAALDSSFMLPTPTPTDVSVLMDYNNVNTPLSLLVAGSTKDESGVITLDNLQEDIDDRITYWTREHIPTVSDIYDGINIASWATMSNIDPTVGVDVAAFQAAYEVQLPGYIESVTEVKAYDGTAEQGVWTWEDFTGKAYAAIETLTWSTLYDPRLGSIYSWSTGGYYDPIDEQVKYTDSTGGGFDVDGLSGPAESFVASFVANGGTTTGSIAAPPGEPEVLNGLPTAGTKSGIIDFPREGRFYGAI